MVKQFSYGNNNNNDNNNILRSNQLWFVFVPKKKLVTFSYFDSFYFICLPNGSESNMQYWEVLSHLITGHFEIGSSLLIV